MVLALVAVLSFLLGVAVAWLVVLARDVHRAAVGAGLPELVARQVGR